MDYQLSILTLQEASLKRELASVRQAVGIQSWGIGKHAVTEYLADLHAGIESLNTAPQSDEERQDISAQETSSQYFS